MSLLLKDLLIMGENQLREAGIDNAKGDAETLMMDQFGMSRNDLLLGWGDSLNDSWCERFFDVIERRAAREPLQHILGVQNFMGYDFKVSPEVLIPRPETEYLTENAKLIIKSKNPKKPEDREQDQIYDAVKSRKRWKVLDMCCGCGEIGISLALMFGKPVSVVGSDVSSTALDIAKENASSLGASNVSFAIGDLFASLGKRDIFDMIICNPPYIRTDVIGTLQPEVKDHEPLLALDGGVDGLNFYRRICAEAHECLNKDGVLLLEIGYDQGNAVKEMLQATGKYNFIQVIKDYNGNDRIVGALI